MRCTHSFASFRLNDLLLPLFAMALCCAMFPVMASAETAAITPSPSPRAAAWAPVERQSADWYHAAPREGKWKKVWKWSAAALVAGSAMDAGSSWGLRRGQPDASQPGGTPALARDRD
jgi:hypothetical protein